MQTVGVRMVFVPLEEKGVMRHLFAIVFAALLVAGCEDEETKNGDTGSEYILINEIDQRANISLYNSKTKKLTKHLFTDPSQFTSQVNGTAQDGDFVYLNTRGIGSTLRKIHISSGMAVEESKTWVDTEAFVHTANNQVVLTYSAMGGLEGDRVCIEIFDHNLTPVDSVVVEDEALWLDATSIGKGKLYYSAVINNEGAFINIFDLTSRTVTKSVKRSDRCMQLLAIDDNRILAFETNKTEILDAGTLEVVGSIPGLTREVPAAVNLDANILYYLKPNPQPAATPYRLYKVNLTTNEHTPLSDMGESVIGPIIYNEKRKTIASGPKFKLFNEDGAVLDHVEDLPSTPLHIFPR